jgi:choline dehydrogenase
MDLRVVFKPAHQRSDSTSKARLQEFDYVIVGAGSAGCVLANGLSQGGQHRVALLEAGPPDRSFWIHLPIGYGKTMWDPKVNWKFETDPDPGMGDRRIYWPRGKVLGGSSSINGLIFIRGQKADYEHWASLGNTGWGWDEVLPYFRRCEGNDRLGGELHGRDGPLKVSSIRTQHPLVEAFIGSATALGLPKTEDFNGLDQEGVGYYQLTTHKGVRCSTATAYLKPARRRANLSVLTGAHATRVIIDAAQRQATGVEFIQNGQYQVLRARREVILSAGALQSPQLLHLSGIGPADLLREHGIAVVHDAPGVGENLQDHLQIRLILEANRPISTNDLFRSWFGRVRMGLHWLLLRSGPLAIGINQGGLFTKVHPQAQTPDIQFHFSTLSADMAGGDVHPFSGFTMSVCQLRPLSRGYVRIRSTDALQPPSMRANYLSHPLDQETVVAAVRFARRLSETDPLCGLVAREHRPGPQARDDAALLDFSRQYGATIFHPSGTCKMGPDSDAMAVTTPRLEVRGVSGLRVVDCSVMPTLVSGNTNWPTVMMAEKAVDMIREDACASRVSV